MPSIAMGWTTRCRCRTTPILTSCWSWWSGCGRGRFSRITAIGSSPRRCGGWGWMRPVRKPTPSLHSLGSDRPITGILSRPMDEEMNFPNPVVRNDLPTRRRKLPRVLMGCLFLGVLGLIFLPQILSSKVGRKFVVSYLTAKINSGTITLIRGTVQPKLYNVTWEQGRLANVEATFEIASLDKPWTYTFSADTLEGDAERGSINSAGTVDLGENGQADAKQLKLDLTITGEKGRTGTLGAALIPAATPQDARQALGG